MGKIGRPQKKGLDYYSFDTTFFEDVKIRKIVRDCQGGNGIIVYIYFKTQIYKNGYYMELDDEWYTWASLDLAYPEDFVVQCIEYMTKIELFDRELYEKHKILTSRDVQKQYFYICQLNKRKKPSTSLPYLLIELPKEETDFDQSETDFTPEEIKDCKQIIKMIFTPKENDYTPKETDFTPAEINFEQSESPQIKLNERKEKERKDIESSLRSDSPSSARQTTDRVYGENIVDCGSNDKLNLLAFQEFFNSEIEKNQARIHKVTQITPARSKLLADRVKEHGKEALAVVVIKAARSPFLNGATEKPFVANFEWLFKPNNYVKVLEGCYDKPSKISAQKLSAAQSWTRCLQDLCNAVGDDESRQIFSHVCFLKFDADTSELHIQVPKKEIYDYMEHNLVKTMSRILPKYFGHNVQLKYHLPKNSTSIDPN